MNFLEIRTDNNGTESVDQMNQFQIKNKIYLNNTREQRTNIMIQFHMIKDPALCLIYLMEYLLEVEK
jgi:hypothetical protein